MSAQTLLPPRGPAFDAYAFARQLAPAVGAAGGVRAVAAALDISAATVSRACRGWAELSHENFIRLSEWMARQQDMAA